MPLPLAELANRGLIKLSVSGPSQANSNSVDLDFSSTGALQVASFDPGSVTAGQVVAISGAGFSSNKEKNVVRLLGAEVQADAQVVDATADQLTVLIPFGAQSGRLSVTNLAGQCATGLSSAPLAVKTSVSGFFKDTTGGKLKGVTVRVRDARNLTKSGVTNDEGSFVIPDLAAGTAEVEVDGTTVPGALPYPKFVFKMRVAAERDNQLEFPGALQAINGASANLSAAGLAVERALSVAAAPDGQIVLGKVILDIPDNAAIRFPDGTTAGRITLSLVERSLTPVPLPERHFSSTIVQISPLGATIAPGAKLTFPNSDGFPANAQVQLFRLDQQRGSDNLGKFVETSLARVSSNGQQIETAAGAVRETTYYFVSLERPTVTVVGNAATITGSRSHSNR